VFSTGLSSGEYGGSVNNIMQAGTIKLLDGRCRPVIRHAIGTPRLTYRKVLS